MLQSSYLVRLKRITGAAVRFVSRVRPSRTERQITFLLLPPPPPTSANTELSAISRTSAPLTVLNWTVITRSTTDEGKTRWKEGKGWRQIMSAPAGWKTISFDIFSTTLGGSTCHHLRTCYITTKIYTKYPQNPYIPIIHPWIWI